jgi:CheY-like chemotaxis protein
VQPVESCGSAGCDVELVQTALADAGLDHQVIPATNKAQFTSALKQRGFDVILSDSSLPAFDGQDALRMARELRPGAVVPIRGLGTRCPPGRNPTRGGH